MGEINVRALEKSDAETCDAIMRSLPEWFSFEPGLQDCARAVRTNEGWVAELDGQLIGFATWEERTPKTAEITWMATDREHRGNGVGTAIIETAAAGLSQRGYALALAMTSAAHKVTVQYPLEGGDAYDATRAFWMARGFHPLVEFDLWETDLALLLVRPLR